MILVDGQPQDRVSAQDRGLLYGDGLFETVRLVGRAAPLWPRHMRRLAHGCERLRLPMPDPALLWREALAAGEGMAQAVVRITLTRGTGARGYAMPATPHATRVVAAFPMPALDASAYRDGIRLHLCATRLAEQPALAGLKHLNRLEQVLARAEWDDPAVAEGLLCDARGRVVSAVSANLFAVVDGVPATPALDRCGVAGVARAEVLDALPRAQVRDLPLDECLRAGELFLTSSVRGILPVQAVGDNVYVPGPVARALQAHWAALGFPTEQA
ncbi:aminodeoxychorismate lyase [Fulvimonas sp. R45]|uniref:aminodeoxychorismate lyase n=1 Tax=Fulvimonas sp. R45 TaxID=3045937 RepID=UPI0026605780|nr:aminodeoxychorismate lyase [Fulvimonas sp. R45]MDO1527387.1 aminodeoxychorismate lyase [Fulvimonas sp. R45]